MLIMVYTNLLGDALWLKKMTVFSRLVMRSAMTPNYALEAHWLCMSTKSNIIVREFEWLLTYLLEKCPLNLTLLVVKVYVQNTDGRIVSQVSYISSSILLRYGFNFIGSQFIIVELLKYCY